MRARANSFIVVGLFTILGVMAISIGIGEAADSPSDKSHSHNSLAGRSFLVNVDYLPPDPTPSFTNCYTFEEDGTFIDPAFLPIPGFQYPGTWIQHTDGAETRYTAFAKSPALPDFGLPPLRLIQNGTVRPPRVKLRLKAYTTVMLDLEGVDVVIANILSTGHEVESCD
jgi:hypothetical protein